MNTCRAVEVSKRDVGGTLPLPLCPLPPALSSLAPCPSLMLHSKGKENHDYGINQQLPLPLTTTTTTTERGEGETSSHHQLELTIDQQGNKKQQLHSIPKISLQDISSDKDSRKLLILLKEKDKQIKLLEKNLLIKELKLEESFHHEQKYRNLEKEFRKLISSQTTTERRQDVMIRQVTTNIENKIIEKLQRKELKHQELQEELERIEENSEKLLSELNQRLLSQQEHFELQLRTQQDTHEQNFLIIQDKLQKSYEQQLLEQQEIFENDLKELIFSQNLTNSQFDTHLQDLTQQLLDMKIRYNNSQNEVETSLEYVSSLEQDLKQIEKENISLTEFVNNLKQVIGSQEELLKTQSIHYQEELERVQMMHQRELDERVSVHQEELERVHLMELEERASVVQKVHLMHQEELEQRTQGEFERVQRIQKAQQEELKKIQMVHQEELDERARVHQEEYGVLQNQFILLQLQLVQNERELEKMKMIIMKMSEERQLIEQEKQEMKKMKLTILESTTLVSQQEELSYHNTQFQNDIKLSFQEKEEQSMSSSSSSSSSPTSISHTHLNQQKEICCQLQHELDLKQIELMKIRKEYQQLMETFQQTQETHHDTLVQIQEENHTLTMNTQFLSQEYDEAIEKIHKLVNKLDDTEHLLSELRRDHTSVLQQQQQLQQQLQQQQQQQQAQETSSKMKATTLNETLQFTLLSLEQSEQKVKQLTNEIMITKSQLHEMTTQLLTVQMMNSTLESSLSDHNEKYRRQEICLVETQEKLMRVSMKLTETEQRVLVAEKEMKKSTLARPTTSPHTESVALQESRAHVACLAKELISLRHTLTYTQSALTQTQANLKSSEIEKNQILIEFDSKNVAHAHSITDLEHTIKLSHASYQELFSSYTTLLERNHFLSNKVQELEMKIHVETSDQLSTQVMKLELASSLFGSGASTSSLLSSSTVMETVGLQRLSSPKKENSIPFHIHSNTTTPMSMWQVTIGFSLLLAIVLSLFFNL
jgi:hypothetical protein